MKGNRVYIFLDNFLKIFQDYFQYHWKKIHFSSKK